MNANLRRGFKRLLIVGSVAWIGVAGVHLKRGLDARTAQIARVHAHLEASAVDCFHPGPDLSPESAGAVCKEAQRAVKAIEADRSLDPPLQPVLRAAAIEALAGPAAALALYLATIWIATGFAPAAQLKE
ncbi:hypothetical protein [Phenylobacterium sp.]|jgi:hypothetical protein|uniref:hypothetical protein n=1 Tax=Phenylobacterium sp. TaxID=1871053 RepID=UPI002E34F2B7|nr:hypothetical protein [Phenylobacterium sp.]HEX4710444.1 hypothetical protein [Phenylobacterium sp.]